MKNKKLLNLYMLTISLVAVVVFFVPLPKTSYESGMFFWQQTVFSVGNIVSVLLLVLIIGLCILCLFKDDYEGLKFTQSFAFVAFLFCNFSVLVFATSLQHSLAYGYIVFYLLIFLLNSFFQFSKIFQSIKTGKSYFKKWYKKLLPKKATNTTPKTQTMLKQELKLKRFNKNKNKSDNNINNK